MTAHRVDCLNAGMDDYLLKPVELSGLATMMSRWARDSHISLPPAASDGVLNRHALDQIRALEEPGEPSLLAEMVGTFGTSTTTYLVRLKETVPTGNCEAVTEAAHALKGAAACIGAERVRALALELELVGRDRSLANAPTRVAELEEACQQALAALRQEVATTTEEHIDGR